MLYEVRMTTSYDYSGPVKGGRHLLRLLPADIPGWQRVVAAVLDISPRPGDRYEHRDFFGNRATGLVLAEPHDGIAFTLRARVERAGPAPALDITPPLSALEEEIAAVRSLAPDAPHHFLPPSPRIPPLTVIRDYALRIARPGASILANVAAISQAIHDDMRFDARATDVETPLETAFAARHGVCQDFSHIMIACLREIGIPAGYVSGFLRTTPPPGQPRLEGADAMHAWVMAWCGRETGWVEFDPTNAIRVANDHVTVARGRDYSDVSPVKGVLWTASSQSTRQVVDLVPLG